MQFAATGGIPELRKHLDHWSEDAPMRNLHRPLRALCFTILALMVLAAAYSAFMSIRYWDFIAV